METSSQENNCSITDISNHQNRQTPGKSTKDLEELKTKINNLQIELTNLRGELANRSIEGSSTGLNPPSISLDNDLQKQVLMLTEAMPHMVWIADSEGRTIHANSRFHEFSGHPKDRDDGWAWVNVLHPNDLQKAIELGNQAALENRAFSMELRCRSSEGDYKWHLMHSIPFFDPSSSSTKWFGTTTCIDDQVKAREELKYSEHKFRTLADAIPQIVFTADADGSIQFWNHRWYEFSGFTEEQSQTEAWQLLIHEQDRKNYLAGWTDALNTGDTFEFEFRIKRALNRKAKGDSPYLWHLARAVALRDYQDRTECWFGTWTDINDQKQESNN